MRHSADLYTGGVVDETLKNTITLATWAAVVILLLLGIGTATTISVGPGESIQSAIDNATDGDVIQVRGGVYHENLKIDNQLTLKGEYIGSGMPVIDAGGDGNGITLKAENVTIQGFEVTNARIGIDIASSNNAIINNKVRNSWTGIALRSSGSNTLKQNEAHDNWRGIYFEDSASNLISVNTVRDNKWSGIVFESSEGNIVKENMICGNYRGIELINSDGNTFIDNKIMDNKYNDEPFSESSTKDLEDIVGEPEPSAESLETSFDVENSTGPVIKSMSTEKLDDMAEVQPEDAVSVDETFRDFYEGETVGRSAKETTTFSGSDVSVDQITYAAEVDLTEKVSEIEAPAFSIDEGQLELVAGDGIDETETRSDFSDAEYEWEDAPDEDLPLQLETAADGHKSKAVSERSSAEPDDVEPAEDSADGYAFEATTEEVEETLEWERSKVERFGGSHPEDISEKSKKLVSMVGTEEEPLDEMDAKIVENATASDVLGEEEGATRRKSSSGGWKVYEYLKALGEMIGGEGVATPPSSEVMNFSEMVETEVERLDLGKISLDSPRQMTIGVSERVNVTIAKNVQEDLKERLESRGAPQAEISKLNTSIRSELGGGNFLIQPLDDDVKFAANAGAMNWSWDVTPLKSGVQDLTLYVIVVVNLPDGTEVLKEYPALEKRTGVDLSFKHVVLYIVNRVSDFRVVYL